MTEKKSVRRRPSPSRKAPHRPATRAAPRARDTAETPSPSLLLAKVAVAAMEEKQGHNPAILDLREKSNLADYFVVVSGHNSPHLRALADEVHVRLKKDGHLCYRRGGDPDSGWIVLDYVDVVIHILLDEKRQYYAIEDFWSSAPTLR